MSVSTTETQPKEVDLFDYFAVIVKHRKQIIRNVLVMGIAVAALSLVLPSQYTAVTTILPPMEDTSTSILSALSNSPLSNLILHESSTTSDLFVEILKSRSVLDGVLQTEFIYPKHKKNAQSRTLVQLLKAKSLEKGRKKLVSRMSVKASAEGIVTVAVALPDRYLAADVANALVQTLDKIYNEKTTSRAKNSRIYIENQLRLTEEKLKTASAELAKYQQKYKAISLEEQTKAAIEKAGELKGTIVAKKVELGVALQTMKPNNVYVIQLKNEIAELERQYNYLQYGNNETMKEQQEFYVPFADVPEVGWELANLMREVKVQETVWTLLNQQYFQAKIQEARDTPTIQVLDEAVPPEIHSKPKRKQLVLIGSFLTLVFSMFWAFALEYLQRLRMDANRSQKTSEIADNLKNDWRDIKSFFRRIRYKINRRS
ncbi:MAG: Wzz/FepE/Etk N-terminal domain-containing protein [candidate division KSB1 bacterium]|nr:Wzz/FepE/Etk N-terminal domain-containing protein [candidate division KSB1 bacterium]MDZ7341756.1 Wzz/FepE/Etk N-terminal domain-containing protein [candidate division KSB1 bacterium]